jgi:AcrR family transcriptional regulator
MADAGTGVAPPSRPLRRDAERNRGRILAAAREVFRLRGFAATLDDVAAHAGLGVATVYRRFPDKDHLVEAILAQQLHDLRALAEQALAAPDPWDALVDFLTRAVELMADDRGVRDVVLSSALGREQVRRARDELAEVTVRLLARAQEAGALRPDLTHTDLPVFMVMLGAVAEYGRAEAPELWRRYLRVLLDGLRASGAPPTPLPVPALNPDALEKAMAAWRSGG